MILRMLPKTNDSQSENASQFTKEQKKILSLVFFTVFIDLIGFGILIPIQPFFAKTLGASPRWITWLGASFSLMQFLFAPFWGKLSDKFGRKPIFLSSIAFTALGYFLFSRAETLEMLFFARMLSGFGSANIGTAQAIIADSTPQNLRAKGMGLIGAAFGLGFIFGPAMGGLLVKWGLSFPLLVAGGLSCLNLLFALFFLPETLPASQRGITQRTFSLLPASSFKKAEKYPNILNLFLVTFIYTFSFSMMEQSFGIYIEKTWVPSAGLFNEENAKKAASLTTFVLLAVGITATFIQGGAIGRLVQKYGEKKLLTTGVALVGLGLLLMPLCTASWSYPIFIMVSILLATGAGLTQPSLNGLISGSVSGSDQGEILGMSQSLSALGRVIGPSLAGLLFEISKGLPFGTAGAVTLLGCLATLRVKSVR
jgi:MFS family permease